jgi:nucleoside-diphosphate-sugar epimerase
LKRLLVSGANGFIGRHVLAALNEDNDGYEVHGLSRSAPAEQEGIYWHQADLLSPSSDKIVRDIGATHLLHLAWETERPAYWTSEDNVLWIEASTRLLRSFQAAGGNSFVGVGTCSEYAPSSERCSELTTPIAPWSIYGASKAALALLAPPLLGPDITATWARLFYLYGPGEPEDRLVPRLLGAVASGEEIKVHVNHVRDYLHVSVLVVGLRRGSSPVQPPRPLMAGSVCRSPTKRTPGSRPRRAMSLRTADGSARPAGSPRSASKMGCMRWSN